MGFLSKETRLIRTYKHTSSLQHSKPPKTGTAMVLLCKCSHDVKCEVYLLVVTLAVSSVFFEDVPSALHGSQRSAEALLLSLGSGFQTAGWSKLEMKKSESHNLPQLKSLVPNEPQNPLTLLQSSVRSFSPSLSSDWLLL